MTLKDQITKTEEGFQVWHQERVIFETTNMMCELMGKAPEISRKELANRLKTTKGYVSQLLDGSTNMTLRTISDAFLAIGYEFHPAFSRIGDDNAEPQISVEGKLSASARGDVVAVATAFQGFCVALNDASSAFFNSPTSLVS